MSYFADIVFPNPIRQAFTYALPAGLANKAVPGIRVWVPLKNHFAFGMIVAVHQNVPDFEVKPVERILDDEVIFSENLLKLSHWMHRFYFCGWGEVIQAALPAGLNFEHKRIVKANPGKKPKTDAKELELWEHVMSPEEITEKNFLKQWKGQAYKKAYKALLKNGALSIWEEPVKKTTPKKMLAWKWTDENAPQRAANFLHLLEGPPAKWQQALDSLLGLKLPEFQTELSKHENINPSFLIRIQKEGFIESSMEPISRFLLKAAKQPVGTTLSELNEEQRKVFKPISETIDREVFDSFVLYGITGSGKTEVYIHAIKKVLELGKTALVLIPEISLTPQTLLRFQAVFGTTIAVLNSRMSDGERQDAWEMVRSGACRIVLGARSAIFAPLPNLGIIVMDEEHDASFKQEDPAPRYHAREVALMRAKLENAVFVGGSATPSLEISHSAGKNRIKWLELPSRHADALLPKVEIIDLREYKHAMRGTLSVALYKAVSEALERKEQIILLQNRRGFAQYLQCEKCGHIPSSPECPVSLTYHKYKNILLCHYSGYSRKADTACEMCGSTELRNMGSGTQSVYENIRELFPAARLMRMDRDTTSTKNAHSKLIHAFSAGEADILIGTQLVAKGLDFPNVTLVGVIDADTELAFPSYRSAERTFQLLSQVAGRAGRAGKPGSVFIQTRNPKSGAIQYAAVHDYKQFAKHELQTRKALQYPPFSRLIGFTFKGKDKDYVAESAFCMADVLSNRMKLHSAVVGPSPSSIARMGDFYYWELMLKIDTEYPTSNIEELLERAMEIYKIETTYKTVRVNIDVGKIR